MITVEDMVNVFYLTKKKLYNTYLHLCFIMNSLCYDSGASIYILGGTYEEDKVNIFVIFQMFTFPPAEAHAIKIIGFENYFLKHYLRMVEESPKRCCNRNGS